MMKKLRAASVVLSTFMLLAVMTLGCKEPENEKKQRVIGVSLLTFKNPFFKVIGDHVTSEGKKHGYTTVVLDAEEDASKQSNQIKDFIYQGVSAIVLSPCESKSVVPAIQEANKAGIPVFTVDIPCREAGVKIVSQIATDNYGGGKLAGQAMVEALGEKGGKVAVLHFRKAESCRLRVKGFTEVIQEHNKTAKNKIEIALELDGGGSKDQGLKAANDAIQTEGQLRGMFCINDPCALGARAAIEKANKTGQIIIVSFDGQPEGKRAILEGKIYAEPIQYPSRMGIQVVEAIVDHSNGKRVKPELLIPPTLYRQEDAKKDPNVDQWQ